MRLPINLNWFEINAAAEVGIRRHIESLRKGLKDAHGFDGKNGWSLNINGALGEMAFAKQQNVYYDGSVNTFKLPDVGQYQIRTTFMDYLIVRPGDSDEDIFVMVQNKCPLFEIVGFMLGADAKRFNLTDRGNGRPPAHFVPAANLSDPRQLTIPEKPTR